jgi:RNA recognition motif-containing protein
MVLAWLLFHLCITAEFEATQDRIAKLEAENANLRARIDELESENENDFHQSATSSSLSSDLNNIAKICAKVFVGGLHHGVTNEILREYFETYGELTACKVYKENKQSRGFGFVTFKEKSSAEKALKDTHKIMGKKVELKPAQSRETMASDLEWPILSAAAMHPQFFTPTPTRMPLPAGQVSQARIAELESEKENDLRQTLLEKQSSHDFHQSASSTRMPLPAGQVSQARIAEMESEKENDLRQTLLGEKPSDLNIDRKVFVGGLNRGVTDAILGEHFQKYGKLEHWQ